MRSTMPDKLGPWIQGKALQYEIIKVKTEQQYVKWIEEYKRQYQQALDMTGEHPHIRDAINLAWYSMCVVASILPKVPFRCQDQIL